MIVRINQFEAARAEQEAGWAPFGLMGPLACHWPAETKAFEVFVLDRDEAGRPLAEDFRRRQMRHLIPQAVVALAEPGEQVVVRLDGPLADGELLGAFSHLTEPDGQGRFAVSEVHKYDPDPHETIASVRVQPAPARLAALAGDPRVGLHRSVRLRAFAVPADFVNPLLDAGPADDERWPELLSRAGFVLDAARGLKALHILTRRFDAAAVKSRLMRRLAAASAAATATSVGSAL
jgi:hypothetical protein